jgi:hypothetical protein
MKFSTLNGGSEVQIATSEFIPRFIDFSVPSVVKIEIKVMTYSSCSLEYITSAARCKKSTP